MGGRPTETTLRARRRLVAGLRARVENEHLPLHAVAETLKLSRQTVMRYFAGEAFPTQHNIVERIEQFIREGRASRSQANGATAPLDLESYRRGFSDGYARGRHDAAE